MLGVISYIDSESQVEKHPEYNDWGERVCNFSSTERLYEEDQDDNGT